MRVEQVSHSLRQLETLADARESGRIVIRWAKIAGVAAIVAAVFAAPAFFRDLFSIGHTSPHPETPQTAQLQSQSAASSVPVFSTPMPTNQTAQLPVPAQTTNKPSLDLRP